MDGVHDMGGMFGHGAMPAERDNNIFHASWEPIGYLSSSAAVINGLFTADAIRYAIERISAQDYMAMPYFERVITGMASLYVEKGLISAQELEDAAGGRFPLSHPVTEDAEVARRNDGGFRIGDEVRVVCRPTLHHCRAPRYSWGATGRILGISPTASLPSEAAGMADTPRQEPTYQVIFDAGDLWPEVEDGSTVVVDLFQSYLERT